MELYKCFLSCWIINIFCVYIGKAKEKYDVQSLADRDNGSAKKQVKYKGKRVHRGLFRSATGVSINADVSVAYNILLKGDAQALPKRSVGGVGGYVIYPLRVSYPAMKL